MAKKNEERRTKNEGSESDLDEKLQLQEQINSLSEQLLRERADAMNVRRRADEERLRMASFYKAHVLKELLPVIDNFERAMRAADAVKHEAGSTKHTELLRGMGSIYKQFVAALEKLGVEKIKTVGEHFDPELHEAVTMEEGDGEHEIVSEELQSGYKIGDEVIRHAMVRVKLG